MAVQATGGQGAARQGTAGQAESPYAVALRDFRGVILIVGLFSAAVNILMLTGPMFMLQVYDRVLASGSVSTLVGLFAIVVVLYAFLAVYDFLRVRFLSRAGYRLDRRLGDPGFRIWLDAGLRGNPGHARPLNDLATLRGFVASPPMLGFFDLPFVPLFLGLTWIIHPWLGMLALAGAGVVFVAALAGQALTSASFREAMRMDATESFFVEQCYRNAEAMRALGMEGRIARRWRAMHDEGLAIGQSGGDRSEALAAGTKAFRLLLQSALLGLGGYLALRQEITPGMIVAASIIAGRALAPIDQVVGQWRAVVRAHEAHRRLDKLMETAGVPDAPKLSLPAPRGALQVRGLTKFAPGQRNRGDRPAILSEVSFALEPGDALGVIGPSASGKTTLARLLVGAWAPDSGEVRLDGARLDQWAPDELGRHVGYLPQSLDLPAGTIAENIARFDPQAKDEEIVATARMAGVHEMILRLPEGYNTRIGHGLPPLSGGQVQRIGLARALYGSPSLVVMDEPNSNLDATGDESLSRAISALRETGAAVVVMAHRPSALAAVNKVMLMHEGRVVQFGPKDEVLAQVGRKPAVVAGGAGHGG